MTYRPALLLLFLNLLIQTCAAQSLNIVSSQWPPYVDDAAADKGLAVELVNKALQRKGYQPRLHIDNWQRALEGVQIGVFDATCAIWKTAEREQDLLFSEPYLNNKISFIKKKNLSVEYTHFTDLTGFIIGVVRDYAYNESFTQSRALIKIPANHIIQNLHKLNQGSIDLTVGDELAIKYALQQYLPMHANSFEFLAPALAYKKLYLAVSKSNKAAQTIIDDFNQAIKEMKHDGSYDQIVSKYQY
ncbi:MAG: transporter substrate-binding domain-containing protein [Methyloprofundus sp.]|nr:transporter substrate-binding domain-containing protein [Methyloprofundus sp.]